MMAINVTQKDETLKAVIAYCEKQRDMGRAYLENVPWLDDGILSWNHGRIRAYEDIITHCGSLLGYTGTSMPLEVQNQSEDARQETGNA